MMCVRLLERFVETILILDRRKYDYELYTFIIEKKFCKICKYIQTN